MRSNLRDGVPYAHRLLFAALAAAFVVGGISAAGAPRPPALGAEVNDSETIVDIPDAALRKAFEEALGKGSGEPITRGEMEKPTVIAVNGVVRLDGIEYAVNLNQLYVQDGAVSDLAPLADLTALTVLSLNRNEIADVSALGALESLTVLSLNRNEIADVSALRALESLTTLYLWGNAISDVSALRALESLTRLNLRNNAISDVSALRALESLTWLDLEGNEIADVSALGALESLTWLNLGDNEIADMSALGTLESLTWLNLGGNKIADVSALRALESLTWLGLWENAISDVSALRALESLTWLGLSGNEIADVSALRALESLTWLGLSGNEIADVSALGTLESLTTLYLSGNEIADVSALRALESLAKLYLSDNEIADVSALGALESLTWLNLWGNAISDVSALGALESLTWLNLGDNEIADMSALGTLESLTWLNLEGNEIADVSALRALESLTWLNLQHNAISDVSALLRNAGLGDGDLVDLRGNLLSAESIETHIPVLLQRSVDVLFDPIPPVPDGAVVAVIADPTIRGVIEAVLHKGAGWPVTADELSNLKGLEVSNRDIEGLSGLELATGLTYLDLRDNAIAGLRPVADMASLKFLHLDGNHIRDIAPLAGLPLQALSLSDNSIEDLDWFADMVDLYWLALDRNSIRDLPTFPDRMRYLHLTDNSISDIAALENLPWLTELRLSGNSIASLRPLASMALSYLHINDNQVTDLSPLHFDSLVELHIRNNAVQDLSPLLSGDRLAMVDARGNPLSREALSVLGTLREAGTTVLAGEAVPYFPAAGGDREGFVRIVNRSNTDGQVFIEAVDDAGVRFGPVPMGVGARRAVHFNSGDLQNGNVAKGLHQGVGLPTTGDWRLEVTSSLDIEVLSYVRTDDGFVTAMHDVAAQAMLPFFNPGSNERQRSILRTVNTEAEPAKWVTGGYDDRGKWHPMAGAVDVQPGHALTLTAQALENAHGLGDGAGKWRLRVRGFPWFAMSLLDSPTGHLTNLSTAPNHAELLANGASRHRVPLFLAAGGAREGFLRVINRSAVSGDVAVEAVDDEGNRFGPVRLEMRARQTVHFNSNDLQGGNAAKGLSGGVGMGEGDWRLELTSELDLQVLSYIRTMDGFLTSMHDLAPLAADGSRRVVFFNPGSNIRQVSKLRLINNGDGAASVTIAGIDDAGADSGTVTFTVPAASALMFTSAELEGGGERLSGGLGDGAGKWRLRVNSDVPLAVMSLLDSPTGHLANVSTGTED